MCAYISVFIFIYRKNCLLIKIFEVTFFYMQPIYYYKDDYFAINEFYKSDNNFMKQTCNYKLYCKKSSQPI